MFAPDVNFLPKDRSIKAGKGKKKESNFFKSVPDFAIELTSSESKKLRDDTQGTMTRYLKFAFLWVIVRYKRTVTVHSRLRD